MLTRMVGDDEAPSRPRVYAAAALPDVESFSGSGGWNATVSVQGPVRAVTVPQAPAPAKRTALIIGINRARGGRPLPGSITDATNLRDSLLGYGFRGKNVTTLLEQEATASRIRHELALLAKRTPADGIAVFAVATHTRRRGGQNEFLTADGLRISASELGAALGKVRSKMWVALPTCYAGGYAVRGIVGRDRVATFASSSTQRTYQLGSAGSYLFINMVRKAMLEGQAPGSVEESFGFAKRTLERESPNRVPTMSDGVEGDLILGEMSDATLRRHEAAAAKRNDGRSHTRGEPTVSFASEVDHGDPYGTEPEPTPAPDRKGVQVCGRVQYRCGPPPTSEPS